MMLSILNVNSKMGTDIRHLKFLRYLTLSLKFSKLYHVYSFIFTCYLLINALKLLFINR